LILIQGKFDIPKNVFEETFFKHFQTLHHTIQKFVKTKLKVLKIFYDFTLRRLPPGDKAKGHYQSRYYIKMQQDIKKMTEIIKFVKTLFIVDGTKPGE